MESTTPGGSTVAGGGDSERSGGRVGYHGNVQYGGDAADEAERAATGDGATGNGANHSAANHSAAATAGTGAG